MHFELSKFKYTDWNLNWIEFQFKWQEMGCKLVKKVLKKYFQETQIQKDVFPCLFTWEWVKIDFEVKFGKTKYYETL